MWSDNGYTMPIEAGKYWLDNHFIWAFTPDGELHKLYKYQVFDDLSIKISDYQSKKPNKTRFLSSDDFETWWQTVDRLTPELKEYEKEAERVIEKALTDYPDHEKVVMTSTGKDSMVTLDLVQRFLPDVKVIFNNTSMDCADTYRLVKSHEDWIISNPKEGFYSWSKRNNFIPSRFHRACCDVFKEKNGIDYLSDNNMDKVIMFMGVRNDESSHRADREDFNHNPKWGNKDWYSCMPIRKFNELLIWIYILKYDLEINTKYKKGYARVGCNVVCPYATKYNWILDRYWYFKSWQRWQRILRNDFVKEQRWTKCNSTIDEYAIGGWSGGLYRPEPNDEVINEFMKYKGLTDRNVALQYFNKTCCVCGKNVRQNDVLGMNLKLHSRDVEKIYCKKHLMELHNMSPEEWDKNVEDFKAQGCKLF